MVDCSLSASGSPVSYILLDNVCSPLILSTLNILNTSDEILSSPGAFRSLAFSIAYLVSNMEISDRSRERKFNVCENLNCIYRDIS